MVLVILKKCKWTAVFMTKSKKSDVVINNFGCSRTALRTRLQAQSDVSCLSGYNKQFNPEHL